MRIGRWSELMFVFFCQLVEVIREVDANETSNELGLALLSSLVGEPEIMLSNMVTLVYVQLEYHALILPDSEVVSPQTANSFHTSGGCPQIPGLIPEPTDLS